LSEELGSGFGRLIDITHRYRIDKGNFAFRRNELDLTVGTEQTYAQIGYLRLTRDIDPTIEDLRDKEELRVAGRVKFARYWSIFGATVDRSHRQGRRPVVAVRWLGSGS
jgi:LPS-assembly protein